MKKSILLLIVLILFGFSLSAVSVRSVRADTMVVYIKPDGSVQPNTAPLSKVDDSVYDLTADISGSLVIERSNIIVDGGFFSLLGSGASGSLGLNVTGCSNVTVRNLKVEMFTHGIHLSDSSACGVLSSQLNNNTYGIWVENSMDILVSENEVNATILDAISLYGSSNDLVSNNTLTFTAGFGIIARSGSNNTIEENDLRDTHEDGLELSNTSNSYLIKNSVFSTYFYGVELASSNDNVVSANSVMNGTGHVAGIRLFNSSNNDLTGNNVTFNDVGFDFSLHSSDNSVTGNTVENSSVFGMTFSLSSGNNFFHNNFVNNAQQVSAEGVANSWDNGYPSGGNYWSNYNGTDTFSGPFQNVTGSDGIGDTPFVISAGNQDQYPLMSPYVVPEFSPETLVFLLALATLSAAVALRKKKCAIQPD